MEIRPAIFLLSPANSSGVRARLAMRDSAEFELARRLREPAGAPLGDVFAFLSGLYFRGKLAYARRFGATGGAGALVITTSRGLLPADTPVTRRDLLEFAEVQPDPADPRYLDPLLRDAKRILQTSPRAPIVLLGSVASGKYVPPLLTVFGERLLFPREFVGRGDMSRGGLMLRRVDSGEELEYVGVLGAVTRGRRPPKLGRR